MFQISITPIVGELLRAIQMPENLFSSELAKLRGMNETSTKVEGLPSSESDEATIRKKIYNITNVLQVPSSFAEDRVLKFAGQTLASKSIVLISVKLDENSSAMITINCEKIVIGSMLAKEMKKCLETTTSK